MAFYNPPFPYKHPAAIKWLILCIGLLLILLSLFMVNAWNRPPKEFPAINSAIAFREQTYPFKINGSVSRIAPAEIVSPLNTSTAASSRSNTLEASLSELMKGAGRKESKSGYYSEIPAGTRLLGVTIQGNTVIVNLSEAFATGGGSTSMIQRVEELKRVIRQFNKNYRLKIAIRGKVLNYLGGEGLEME